MNWGNDIARVTKDEEGNLSIEWTPYVSEMQINRMLERKRIEPIPVVPENPQHDHHKARLEAYKILRENGVID